MLLLQHVNCESRNDLGKWSWQLTRTQTCTRKATARKITKQKELSSLSVIVLYVTAFVPLLGKMAVLVGSRTGDFHKMQKASSNAADLVGVRGPRIGETAASVTE